MTRFYLKVFKRIGNSQSVFCYICPDSNLSVMGNKKLTRSNNRMIAGVCAGIAEYFNLDITLVRIVYVLLSFFTAFTGGIVYLILWLIMPETPRNME